MDIAFCAFDGMDPLDFVGTYEPLTHLDRLDIRSLDWDVCGWDQSVSSAGLGFDTDCRRPDLGAYDLLFVPGGPATRELRTDAAFISWLQTADGCEYLTSVCTGALLLDAAGYLEGRRATTHPRTMSELRPETTAVTDRVVRDGPVITARGVSSSLDLGLALVEELAGGGAREQIAARIDYPPDRTVTS